MFQEKWRWANDHSFTGANIRWKSYKPDALKHGSALALPQWAPSQYCTIVTRTAHVLLFSDIVKVEFFRHYMSRLPNFTDKNDVQRCKHIGNKKETGL